MALLEAPDGKNVSAGILIDDNALLPEVGPSGTSADLEEKTTSNQISIYIVREGDTLSTIARMFEVSQNTIVWANDLKSKSVRPGQELIILPVTGVQHKIQKGETIISIAKKYKSVADEVATFNGLNVDDVLTVGETLIIPEAELAAVPTKSTTVSSSIGKIVKDVIGFFIRPAEGICTNGYHGNNGRDIGGSIGSAIYAAATGNVIVAKSTGYNGGYGKYVVISHDNGLQTLYAHLTSVAVTPGQRVEQGAVIGGMGNTGKVKGATGIHLHFEVRGGKNPFCN
ncbi:MAG: peptidoglycan DD-metalloendopeptidase family protein [Candidatus Doudnabacteria bacterium]|nr:peptidoglycan DD-metalloendopeptidase family protein [Candidatus Doudnabacteria bacterium]